MKIPLFPFCYCCKGKCHFDQRFELERECMSVEIRASLSKPNAIYGKPLVFVTYENLDPGDDCMEWERRLFYLSII